MLIRPFQASDQPAVITLWHDVFPNPPKWNVPQEDIQRKQHVQPDLFLIAEIDRDIVGTAMGGFDGHRGWVYFVGVHRKFRRRGIARQLMIGIETGLVKYGCTKLNLQVRSANEEAVGFYRQLGYLVEDRISLGKRLQTDEV